MSVPVTWATCPVASCVCIITNDKDVDGSRRGLIQGSEKTHDEVSVPAEVRTGYIPNIIQDCSFQAN